MTAVQVVVVDLDDTLFPERDYVRSGFAAVDEEVRRAFGVTGFGTAAWTLFEAGVRGRIFDEALGSLGLPADAATVKSLIECYRAHRPSIDLYPDVAVSIRALGGRARAAIVSDGPLAAQERKVDALGLPAWFDPILLTDRWGREYWKPHERAFREIETVTGTGGAHCAYLEGLHGAAATRMAHRPRAPGRGRACERRRERRRRGGVPEPRGRRPLARIRG